MRSEWVPFGKPIRYCRPRTPYHESSGWLIAWRPNFCTDEKDYVDAIEYLTLDCSIIVINEGDKLEIMP